ncbi:MULTISPECIES: type VII secretion target [unclassified Saccharopolyspora]|uniref:type VII secretion target n=1 Tax=Saccharopolyspora TaxID=1835 RepID=UPI00190DC82E|nr:type VII secretion target [Saccharopolyspora sp. HNM0986]MBK0865362.1 hypothetical protein [Saccharopolyspora sp. HNM0986]
MGEGFDVGPEELRKLASNISEVVSESDAEVFARIGRDGMDFGHGALSAAFRDFCSGLESSVNVLKQTAESAGDSLRESARTYEVGDDAARQSIQQSDGGV